ncbi:MAG: hypothetical protein ABJN36_12735 [Cyclobacteriaceae bacterium]
MIKKLKSIQWRELIIQMVSVSFGVLFALWINQWREEQKEERDQGHALQSIANEIAFNKQFLNSRLDYYSTVLNAIDSLESTPDVKSKDSRIAEFHGLRPPFLRRSSFDLGLNTGMIRHFDYELSDDISTIYAFQDFFLKVVEMQVSAYIGQMSNPKENQGLDEIYEIFKDWETMGKELIGTYDTISKRLPSANRKMNQ